MTGQADAPPMLDEILPRGRIIWPRLLPAAGSLHPDRPNVYPCPGTRWYGKTKKGEYMSEAAATAEGARPDHGKACGS